MGRKKYSTMMANPHGFGYIHPQLHVTLISAYQLIKVLFKSFCFYIFALILDYYLQPI